MRASILVIDDEPGLRDMLAYELSQDGFEVETADSGMAAVERVKRRKFDLAITDLKMPGMDGIATLEALRKIDPDMEVIVATGYASVETAIASLKRGAYDYIQKPFDLNELKSLLERAMEKSHLQGVVALYEASRALLATLNPSGLVTLVLDIAKRILRVDNVALVLTDAKSKLVTVQRLGTGTSDETFRALAERAVSSGTLRLTQDDPECPKGVGSALVYRLSARERTLGTLILVRTEPFLPFSVSEFQRGTVFASQLALALDNAGLHEELAHKVDELVRTRQQLVHTEKLGLAGDFARAVAHELNSPVAVVQANLSALSDYSSSVGELWLAAKSAAAYLRTLPNPEARDASSRLAQKGEATDAAVRDIAEVIDDVLESVRRIADLVGGFTKLASAKPDAAGGTTEVAPVVERCVAMFQASECDIESTTPSGLRVGVSAESLRTAILNVLSFLRHPDRTRIGERGRIKIKASAEKGFTRIRIIDERLTLSPEEMLRLFDPRIEVDTAKSRTMRLNIALALTYQLLHRSGGDLLVHPEGAGTAFDLVVPTANSGVQLPT